MTKPLQDISFFLMGDRWQDVEGNVLADFLANYEMIVDDRTQFARMYDYDRNVSIWYRASAGKIRITIWRIGVA